MQTQIRNTGKNQRILRTFYSGISGSMSGGVADPDPGSGIRCFLTHGYRIRNEHPGLYFQELRKNFFGSNILKFCDVDYIGTKGTF
jgi:methyl coenzyme M reductase gamma subunit